MAWADRPHPRGIGRVTDAQHGRTRAGRRTPTGSRTAAAVSCASTGVSTASGSASTSSVPSAASTPRRRKRRRMWVRIVASRRATSRSVGGGAGWKRAGAVRHGTAPSRWSSIAEWNGDADRSSACAGVLRETRTALLERRHAGRMDDVHVGGPARKERVFRAAALRARGGGVDRGSTLGQERSPQVRPRRAGSRHECHAPTTYRPAMTTGRPRRADHARRLRRTRGRHLHRARFPTVAVAPTTGLGPDPESNRDTTTKAVRLPTKL